MIKDVEKVARVFSKFEDADRVDRDYYRKLSPQERLAILLQLINHAPEQRLERVHRVTKFSPR